MSSLKAGRIIFSRGIISAYHFLQHNQVQYEIERDRQIIDFYRQHNLDYHQGLNNFLQTDSERRDKWFSEYYTYLRQPLHLTLESINTPQLQLDIPQLTFSDLKQKYSQFWETDNTYFSGGETQAIATEWSCY